MIEHGEVTEATHPTTAGRLSVLFVGKAPLNYVGGAEVSTRHLLAALVVRGHDVSVLTSTSKRTFQGFTDFALSKVGYAGSLHEDSSRGYRSINAIYPLRALTSVRERSHANVTVVTGTDPRFAKAALNEIADQPSVLYVRVEDAVGVAADAHTDLVITNSRFMAEAVRDACGSDAAFLPSMFPRSSYELSPLREKVLFINPVPKKGVDIALYLAERRADIPFVFSLSWQVKQKYLRALRKSCRGLGNIEIRSATAEPAELYRDCKILIVPSQCDEAWSRVVSEAQISGIPVIASRAGGIPEAMGPGGVLVDPPDSKAGWEKALSEVWDDEDRYRDLSKLALEHSRRDEIAVDEVVSRFEDLMSLAIANHARCG